MIGQPDSHLDSHFGSWEIHDATKHVPAQVTQRNGAPTQRSPILGPLPPGRPDQQYASKFVILNPQEIPLPAKVREAAKLRENRPQPITEWTMTK